MARSGIAGSYSNSTFSIFWGTTILFSTVTTSIYFSTNSVEGFPFLHILWNTCYLEIFLMMALLTSLSWYLIVILIFISQIINSK